MWDTLCVCHARHAKKDYLPRNILIIDSVFPPATTNQQIGSLAGHYLFEHHGIHKRSLSHSEEQHKRLENEQQVSQCHVAARVLSHLCECVREFA